MLCGLSVEMRCGRGSKDGGYGVLRICRDGMNRWIYVVAGGLKVSWLLHWITYFVSRFC
jgi:hypothetical protein